MGTYQLLPRELMADIVPMNNKPYEWDCRAKGCSEKLLEKLLTDFMSPDGWENPRQLINDRHCVQVQQIVSMG